ncbi:MAG: arsenate reductase (glutaredoxin) [Planctomycetes bacterium]|nr:arsenate reductase (glutaredoxin) [Planctomycetota bacterium]
MVKLTIYHNPRCTKSREALERLADRKVPHEVVLYLDAPLSKTKLQELVKQVGGDPNQLLRRKDPKFKEAGLDPQKNYSAAEVVALLAEYGHLMERPVVVKGSRAVVARPTERLDDLL